MCLGQLVLYWREMEGLPIVHRYLRTAKYPMETFAIHLLRAINSHRQEGGIGVEGDKDNSGQSWLKLSLAAALSLGEYP